LADVDGEPGAELLANDVGGIAVYKWDPTAHFFSASADNIPALTADVWSTDRSYWATIQTGDVDGDKRSELLARGPYGARTWRYQAAQSTWSRYVPAGGFPAFTGMQATAYTAYEAPACGEPAIGLAVLVQGGGGARAVGKERVRRGERDAHRPGRAIPERARPAPQPAVERRRHCPAIVAVVIAVVDQAGEGGPRLSPGRRASWEAEGARGTGRIPEREVPADEHSLPGRDPLGRPGVI